MKGLHYEGRGIIIDTAQIGTIWETMVLKPDGEEIESLTAPTLEEARCQYKSLMNKYAPSKQEKEQKPEQKPLTGKYLQLAKDLAEAVKSAEHLRGTDDGGTCNFDSPTVRLPRWNRELVEQAANEAGLGCFVWNLWGSKSYVFPVRGCGQANNRTVIAEQVSRYLRSKGYDAGMYYQCD